MLNEHQPQATEGGTHLDRGTEDTQREAATASEHATAEVRSTGFNRRWDDPQPLTVVTRVDGTVTLVDGTVTLVGAETTFDL